MHIACCQFDIAWEDKPANYLRVERRVREANLEPGTLLLLPEMFATGFSMNAEAIAETPDGPTAQFVAELA
jgi:omega-amidase